MGQDGKSELVPVGQVKTVREAVVGRGGELPSSALSAEFLGRGTVGEPRRFWELKRELDGLKFSSEDDPQIIELKARLREAERVYRSAVARAAGALRTAGIGGEQSEPQIMASILNQKKMCEAGWSEMGEDLRLSKAGGYTEEEIRKIEEFRQAAFGRELEGMIEDLQMRRLEAEVYNDLVKESKDGGAKLSGAEGQRWLSMSEIQRGIADPNVSDEERRQLIELKSRLVREVEDYVKANDGNLAREIQAKIEEYLRTRVFPGAMGALRDLSKQEFVLSVNLPEGATERWGGVVEQVFADEVNAVIASLVRIGEKSEEGLSQADKKVLASLSWDERNLQGRVDIGVQVEPMALVRSVPSNEEELAAVLRSIPSVADRKIVEDYVRGQWRKWEGEQRKKQVAEQQRLVEGTPLEGAVKQKGTISLEDAAVLVGDQPELVIEKVTSWLNDLWNSQDQQKRVYAKGALAEFMTFQASVGRKDLRLFAQFVDDSLRLFKAREEWRNVGLANDPKGAVEAIIAEPQLIGVFSGDEHSGEERLRRWFGPAVKYLAKLDEIPNYWRIKFATSDLPGMPPLQELQKQIRLAEEEIEPDPVKRAMMHAVLEIFGVYAERASEKENGFGAGFHGNISYLMNPEEYLLKRRMALNFSEDPLIDDAARSQPDGVSGARRLHLPPLIASYLSFVLWRQGVKFGEPNEPRCMDFSGLPESMLAAIEPDPGSYREWAVLVSKAAGALKGIEELVSDPTLPNLGKMMTTGLPNFFSAYNRPEDGFDLAGRGEKEGERYVYGGRREAVLVELVVFVFTKRLGQAMRERLDKAAKGEQVEWLFPKQTIAVDIWKQIETGLSAVGAQLPEEFMGKVRYTLQQEGLYPSDWKFRLVLTVKAALRFGGSILRRVLGTLAKGG